MMAEGVSGRPITPAEVKRLIRKGLKDASEFVRGHWMAQAKHYAPRSPTQSEIDQERAMKTGSKRKGTYTRRRRRKNRPEPGGLEKSISAAVDETDNTVNVACFASKPSPAEKYADVIHNQKGTRWQRRGIGTRNKGSQADEKFIERAGHDNEERYFNAFKKGIADAVKEGGGSTGSLRGGRMSFGKGGQ